MADTPFPLARELRESEILDGDGTAGPYGPSQYKVFDTADVAVFTRAAGETAFSDVTAAVAVGKTADLPFDTFSVTFPAALAETTQWYHQARRTAERSVAVNRAGTINATELEKELSKQATAQSELRRDVDRSVRFTDPAIVPTIDAAPNEFLGLDATGTKLIGKGTPGQLGAGDMLASNDLTDLHDKDVARTNIGAAADPVLPAFAGAVPVPLRLITQDHVNPAWFGLTGGATEDLAYTRALKAGIEDNKPAVIEADHTLDVIDLSAVAAGGALRIRHTGKLTQVGASSADMFKFGTRDVVKFFGPGEFDGQKDSQTANRIIIPVANVDRFHARGLIFRNVKRGAVHQQNPLATSFILEDFACYEGGLHNGVTNDQSCEFVLIRSGLYARVSRFRMIQTADPAANTNRNPAGIFYINSGSSPGSGQVVIEDGYLENLGYSSASNHVGMVDFYNRAEKIDLKRLTFRKSRFLPIRTNYAKIVSISECDVEVPTQMYLNDTTLYSDAAAYTCGMVDRSYATDGGHTEQVTIEKCVALISGNHNCRAVSAVGGDNDYLFKKLVLDTNNFRHAGTNSSAAVFTSTVVDVEEIAPTTESFDIGTRTQGTSTVGSAAASETNAVYRRSGGRTKGGSNGLYARDNVANLNVTLEDASMSGQSSSSYSVRTAKNVRVERNTLPNPGDAQNNAAFWFRDNNAGGTSDPTGYTTNTYHRLRDNVGRNDVASA